MTSTTRTMTRVGLLLDAVSLTALARAETVDTRIGKLELEVGYPSTAKAPEERKRRSIQASAFAKRAIPWPGGG